MMRPIAKLVVTGALLSGSVVATHASADDVPISEEARSHFAAGVALLQDPKAPRYEEAYREFKSAYASSPSYRILGNLGLCAMKIERDTEAINAYETYLAQAGLELTPGEREQIERDLATLKAGLVSVTVSSDPPGALIIDVRTPVQGLDVRNVYGQVLSPLSLGIRRGHHVITARLAGYLDQQWEFDANDPALPPHVFTMVKPAERETIVARERPIPTSAYILGGAALALAAGGAVVGVLALNKHAEYERENDGVNPSGAQSIRSTGLVLNAATDALLGSAVVAVGAAAYLIATRATIERRIAQQSPFLPLDVGPLLGPRTVGGAAAWRF
ncbi:MAG TPA: hypothetical protein VEK07_14150 [Polyangiaceae bacterium]|nr:hypothetical protein [Polyangiaceae bacterium]